MGARRPDGRGGATAESNFVNARCTSLIQLKRGKFSRECLPGKPLLSFCALPREKKERVNLLKLGIQRKNKIMYLTKTFIFRRVPIRKNTAAKR